MTHTRHYRIKEVSIAYKQFFLVLDDEEKTPYVFHYEYDKIGKKLILINSSGKVLINIHRIHQMHPTFDIYSIDKNDHHSLLGVFRRVGPLWHHKFIIESIYGEYQIDRSRRLSNHEYQLMKDQELIANIKQDHESDELVSIEIAKNADAKKDEFILALVMIRCSL